MYIPPSFEQPDLETRHRLIEQFSFGLLVTTRQMEGSLTSEASHLPFLLDRTIGRNGRLIGHFARANSQWQNADGTRALAIFSGPHAYISPTWYAAQNAVPTWNYVAVHASGTLRLIEDPGRLLQIVRDTVERYEAPRSPQWSLESPDPAFIDKLLDAIVGFEIDIERLEGKWKLSQNHDAARRAGVIRGLTGTGHADDAAIARLMAEQG